MMRRFVVSLLVLIALALAACGGEERPTLEAWVPLWNDAVATVERPTASGPPGEAACETALGELRAAAVSLKPTPDPILDDTVTSWLETAEGTMFECSQSLDEVAVSSSELERLEAEVAAVIEIDDPST